MSTMLLPADRQEPAGYVLVVAHDVFLRKLVRRQIEEMGLEVQEALSVERGLGRVRAAVPSLVLLDPWVDNGLGLGFLEVLRAQRRDLPVMLVGAEPRGELRRRGLELGALGHVPLAGLASIACWVEAALDGEKEAGFRLIPGGETRLG